MEIINGHIIDFAPAAGTWFIIFGDDREPAEGFTTKADAIAHLNTQKG